VFLQVRTDTLIQLIDDYWALNAKKLKKPKPRGSAKVRMDREMLGISDYIRHDR
jgi:hypothetical protein